MKDRVADLQGNARVRGLQLAALHYLHLRQLDGVRDWACGQLYGDDGVALRRWERLWACPPYGADYGRRPRRAAAHPCGLAWLCPWCWARRGVRLWQRLRAGLGGRELTLLCYALTSDDLERCDGVDPRFDDFRYAQPREAVLPIGFGLRVGDPYRVLTDRQVRAARAAVGQRLDRWAGRLGLRHGLKAFAVEPALWRNERLNVELPQYRFVGRLLGQPPAGDCPDPWLHEYLSNHGQFRANWQGLEEMFLTRGQLRQLLTRALAWPAVMLLGPEQWVPFAVNTQGIPACRAFGDWQQLLSLPQKPDPRARPSAGQRALDRHNRRRAAEARTDYERLLKAAQGVWPKVLAPGPSGRRGRPPYRQRLVALLAGLGLQVGRRQLDRLMADLQG
jgi:hypothetical protein